METPESPHLTSLSQSALEARISQILLNNSRTRYQLVRDLVAEGMTRNDADLLVAHVAKRVFPENQGNVPQAYPVLSPADFGEVVPSAPLTQPLVNRTFKSPQLLAWLIMVCFVGIILVDIWGITNTWRTSEFFTSLEDGDRRNVDERAKSIDDEALMIALSYIGIALITVICFLRWLYLCRRNIEIWAVDIRFTPKWTWLGFGFPLLQLWRPHQVVQEIWQASTPSYPTHRSGEWKHTASSGVVTLWWILYICNLLLSRVLPNQLAEGATLEDYSTNNSLAMMSHGLNILAAFLALTVVYQLTQRQLEKFQSLGSE